MNELKALSELYNDIEKLKMHHYTCDDDWHSCPKSEEGCGNELQGDECTCGAEYTNDKIDSVLNKIKQILLDYERVKNGLSFNN